MNEELLNSHIQKHLRRLDCLIGAESMTIGHLLKNRILHDSSGVYAILVPDDSEVIYVGRTKTKGVAGRIADHRSINTPSDLRGMLKNNPQLPQQIDEYRVRYVPIEESRDRLFFEMFAIGCLRPRLNK